jgi:hypothetical protein
MVYNSQNCWVFGLFPSCGILQTREHNGFGNWICFLPQVRGEDTYSVGTIRKGELQGSVTNPRLALPKGPDKVGVFSPPHLRKETDPLSETLCSVVSRIPDDGKSPNKSVSGQWNT